MARRAQIIAGSKGAPLGDIGQRAGAIYKGSRKGCRRGRRQGGKGRNC